MKVLIYVNTGAEVGPLSKFGYPGIYGASLVATTLDPSPIIHHNVIGLGQLCPIICSVHF
jgi:hypothetical protein